MRYLIGTDEAGYGPNLGPLVVSASCWQVPDDSPLDLYHTLRHIIRQGIPAKSRRSQLPIADSKRLYKSPAGLANLELTVLATLAVAQGDLPHCWRDIWSWLDPTAAARLSGIPWYKDYDERLPIVSPAEDVLFWRGRLMRFLDKRGIALTKIVSRVVFAEQFNELLDECPNKNTCLSQITINLARDLSATLADGSILIHCDKHGGRNRYGDLLQEAFPQHLVEIYGESRETSVYRLGPATRRSEFHFSAHADRNSLPTALASMVSKYLRELAMRAFNRFWWNHKNDLRPTAGYPVDAHRFLAEISMVKSQLDIPDRQLWRVR